MNSNLHDFDTTIDRGSGDTLYGRAIIHCADTILRLHFAEKVANKIFGRNLQSHAAGLVLVMHCEALLGLGPRPTLSLVQREMGSSRTLSAFFGLLRWAGYVMQEPMPTDARAAWLVPAPPLFEGLRQWLSNHARCSELLGLAEPGLSARLKNDDAWLLLYLGHSRALLARTRESMAGEGAFAWFDRFDCGDRIALVLLRAHHAGAPGSGGAMHWFDLGGREIAARLGVSHSHVRNVVNRAESEGLVLQERGTGRIALTPRLLAESEAWFRSFWGWIAETGRAAERREAGQR